MTVYSLGYPWLTYAALTMLTTWHEHLGTGAVEPDHCILIEQLLTETRETQLFKLVTEAWPEGKYAWCCDVSCILTNGLEKKSW